MAKIYTSEEFPKLLICKTNIVSWLWSGLWHDMLLSIYGEMY